MFNKKTSTSSRRRGNNKIDHPKPFSTDNNNNINDNIKINKKKKNNLASKILLLLLLLLLLFSFAWFRTLPVNVEDYEEDQNTNNYNIKQKEYNEFIKPNLNIIENENIITNNLRNNKKIIENNNQIIDNINHNIEDNKRIDEVNNIKNPIQLNNNNNNEKTDQYIIKKDTDFNNMNHDPGNNIKQEEYITKLNEKRVAYVITITKEGEGPFFETTAILVKSLKDSLKDSKYPYDLIAFVHPEVTNMRPGLELLGFKIIEKDVPIEVKDIRGTFLRESIEKGGCCGARELIKLYSYTLVDYYRVLHLDTDELVFGNFDELFDMEDKKFIFTYDWKMNTPNLKAPPIQGGFLLFKPDLDIFHDLIEIVLEGDFASGSGWGKSGIGWHWGGKTIQGILPYYYHTFRKPEEYLAADDTIWNNMAQSDAAKDINVHMIRSFHFTCCDKPWSCRGWKRPDICGYMHKAWFELRREIIKDWDIPFEGDCMQGGRFHSVKLEDVLEKNT